MLLNVPLSPLLAVAIYGIAVLVSFAFVRVIPAAARTIREAEGRRYETVDGLRAFLAVGVFIHHCAITWFFERTGSWTAPPSNLYNELGRASVALFFMITSFLFWGKAIDQGDNLSWRRLYVGRFFRLYPLYLFMFVLVVVGVFAASGWSLQEGRFSLFKRSIPWLVFGIPRLPDLNGMTDTNVTLTAGVIWSLAYEWGFYCALPVLALLFARSRKALPALVGGCALTLIFAAYKWKNAFDPSILLAFLGGFIAAHWARDPELSAYARSWPASVLAAVSLGACAIFYQQPFAPVPLLLLSVSFVIVASGNTFFGVLHASSLRWLGTISYGTYLLQGPLLWLFLRKLFFHAEGGMFVFACLIACAALVLTSSATFLLVEKPGMALGRYVSNRWFGSRERPQND